MLPPKELKKILTEVEDVIGKTICMRRDAGIGWLLSGVCVEDMEDIVQVAKRHGDVLQGVQTAPLLPGDKKFDLPAFHDATAKALLNGASEKDGGGRGVPLATNGDGNCLFNGIACGAYGAAYGNPFRPGQHLALPLRTAMVLMSLTRAEDFLASTRYSEMLRSMEMYDPDLYEPWIKKEIIPMDDYFRFLSPDVARAFYLMAVHSVAKDGNYTQQFCLPLLAELTGLNVRIFHPGRTLWRAGGTYNEVLFTPLDLPVDMHGNQAHEVATVFLSYSICGQRWKGVSFGSLEEFQTLSVDSGERSFVDSFRHFVVMLPPEDAVATLRKEQADLYIAHSPAESDGAKAVSDTFQGSMVEREAAAKAALAKLKASIAREKAEAKLAKAKAREDEEAKRIAAESEARKAATRERQAEAKAKAEDKRKKWIAYQVNQANQAAEREERHRVQLEEKAQRALLDANKAASRQLQKAAEKKKEDRAASAMFAEQAANVKKMSAKQRREAKAEEEKRQQSADKKKKREKNRLESQEKLRREADRAKEDQPGRTSQVAEERPVRGDGQSQGEGGATKPPDEEVKKAAKSVNKAPQEAAKGDLTKKVTASAAAAAAAAAAAPPAPLISEPTFSAYTSAVPADTAAATTAAPSALPGTLAAALPASTPTMAPSGLPHARVCTKCGRFIAHECQNYNEPHGRVYFKPDVITSRSCTSNLCKTLNFIRNSKCYKCNALFPTRDCDAQQPLGTDRDMTAMDRATQRQNAAKVLQRWVRGNRELRLYRRLSALVVVTQAVWRGAVARRHFAHRRAAALRIQAFVRETTCRARWVRMRRAAIRLQVRVQLRAAASLFRRERDAIVTMQALWRGAAVRNHAAVRRIQAVARGAATKARQMKMNRAAIRLQAHARRRAATATFRRQRDAVITLQGMGRCMLARRKISELKTAPRRKRTFGAIGSLVTLAIVAAIMVGFLFGGASPCQRGGTLSSGDPPLAPGECIEGAAGSRLFGWIPGVSARARLSVKKDGRMVAKNPDGAEVVLVGHIPADGRSRGLLCTAERIADFLTGKSEPDYGARHVHGQLVLGKEYHCSVFRTAGPKGVRGLQGAWLERGGGVGFSSDGDLEVVSSEGRVWWSLANYLTEEDVNKAGTDSARPSTGKKKENRKEKWKEEDKKTGKDRTNGDKRKDKKKTSPEPDRPGQEGGKRKWPWKR